MNSLAILIFGGVILHVSMDGRGKRPRVAGPADKTNDAKAEKVCSRDGYTEALWLTFTRR